MADASSPFVENQIKSVNTVLEELGVDVKDTILVLNKLDAVADHIKRDRLCERYPYAVGVSAKSGFGLDKLAECTSEL